MDEIKIKVANMGDDFTEQKVAAAYETAADVVNLGLAFASSRAVPGADIAQLCADTDAFLAQKVAKRAPKLGGKRGLAIPTSLAVNNIAGPFCPDVRQKPALKLAEGDLLKIDVGVHVNDYISVSTHTMVVSADLSQPISGPKADVICAAYFASEAALRCLVPGGSSAKVTQVIQKVADDFGVKPLHGVLSHRLKQGVLDGNDVILNGVHEGEEADDFEFKAGDVFALDIVMSTGCGEAVEYTDVRPQVFRRAPDVSYNLKSPASRKLVSFASREHGVHVFALRHYPDLNQAKLGLKEAVQREVLEVFPTVCDKEKGALVAQFKFTVAITAKKTAKLNAHALPYVQSALQVQDAECQQLMAKPLKHK